MKSWASIVSSPPPSPAGEVAQPKQVVAESKADGHLVAAASINPIKPAEVLPRPPRGPRKRVVVVDTNSIINNVPFSSFGEQFVTVSEVLEEVRDPEARRRLEQMMMLTKLETRVPSKEAVAKVVAFANGTGDIGILSGADIKLIALTRMIELELNGEEHLRSSPVAQAQVFSRPAEEEVEGGDDDQDGEDSFYDGCVVEELHEGEEHEHKVVEVSPNPAPLSRAPVAKAKSPKVASSAPISLPGWGGDWVSDSVQLQEAKQGETVPDGKEIEEEEGSTVACLTADFAMQNVLIQMGLRVLSPDGKRITRVKQWALRCFACFKITRNMEKQFCPQCGNNTLKRVSISVDAKGSVMAFFNPKKKISTRGTKFPIPKPTGGRANVFVTDECELPKAKVKNYSKQDAKVTEYGFGDARNRVVERPKVGYGKKNPNESKKRTDKKKKKHTNV